MERLRVDRAHGAAPNKPLLLLAVIELIEQGEIQENKIILSPSLAEIFLKYWSKVTDRKSNIALPFFHLKSDGFWHLHSNVGYETALSVASQLKTASRIREVIAYASLDDEFFILLTVPHDREVLRQTLIRTYLSDFKQEIEDILTEKASISEYRQKLLQQVEDTFVIQKSAEPIQTEDRIRSAGFRQAIIANTVATPMIIPSIVSNERILFERIAAVLIDIASTIRISAEMKFWNNICAKMFSR